MNQSDFENSLNDFMNRQIYIELSLELLESIPNNSIEQVIIDFIGTKIIDYQRELNIVSDMSEGFQMMYSTWILEGEVNNGGFNQFFVNSSSQFADIALRSLKMIGATEYYEILRKAIEIHLQEKNNPDLQKLYSLNTLEAFSESYKLTALNECDEAFYKLGDSISELRIQYIRSNPHLFVGN